MSAFDQDFAAADDLLDEIFGGPVTLVRGANSSESFTASWDLQEYEVESAAGAVTVVQSRDYLVPKVGVTIAGQAVTPRPGDRIVDQGVAYEVLPIGARPAVEDAPGGSRWICHTKRVSG